MGLGIKAQNKIIDSNGGKHMAKAVVDHLVVAASRLEAGVEYIKEVIGVEPSGGGKHISQGTHNKVLRLAGNCYLEVIAIDPEGEKPGFPRWFDLDAENMRRKLKERPRLITWVARTEHLEALVGNSSVNLGEIRPMSRGALSWKLTFTDDGKMPGGGLIPPLIKWETPAHPAGNMAASGCSLIRLEGHHPDPDFIRGALDSLGLSGAMEIKSASGGEEIGLKALLSTPFGEKVLV